VGTSKTTPTFRQVAESLPDADALAALRAWYEGLGAREAVRHYLAKDVDGQSSRGILGGIRRRLVGLARARHRDDLAELLNHPAAQRSAQAKSVARAIEVLRELPPPQPLMGDPVSQWLSPRAAQALQAQGLHTLAALTLRIPRRRQWWMAIPGLGLAGARQIEAFFAAHPQLTERARALVEQQQAQQQQQQTQNPQLALHRDGLAAAGVVPWERLRVPHEVDGSQGTFRAPAGSATLGAHNDYEAVQAWLSLHESGATQRAYRKEAERLILWAVVERGRALSSLMTEDAVAYRAFLRHPAPQARWVGPPRPRTSPDWRPFAGGLSARSVAYALSVLGAMYRWLIEQRYTLANPFAGIKVRGASRAEPLAAARVFGEGEWRLIQTVAEGLEWSHGWTAPAAQRLRFLIDFAYATGLRASELVDARLGQIGADTQGDHWLSLVGKGSKAAKVGLPPLAQAALERYLVQRGLPAVPARWDPGTPLIGRLVGDDDGAGITAARLWYVMRRFFATTATAIEAHSPATAEKLRRASPHWMRHTHATHALARGVELNTVRDNLRHASLSTTSIYLHTDEVKRAQQLRNAFGVRDGG
jgi:site-specific recombinase XerD